MTWHPGSEEPPCGLIIASTPSGYVEFYIDTLGQVKASPEVGTIDWNTVEKWALVSPDCYRYDGNYIVHRMN